ncbi:HAD family hydrolase [soil metagenome]|jgi:HAD superfamily hydrolase (TIGR01509 family)|nr:HAD family hydrolase [Deinococcota bacterium]
MRLRALLFDFDGTILDTESSEFASWQAVYREHGCELGLAEWLPCIGTAENVFDPLEALEQQLGRSLERERVEAGRREAHLVELDKLTVLAGVAEYIREAERRGVALAVASSSSRAWVEGHLGRLGLLERFAVIRCRDDVRRTKPDPELFLAAVRGLGVRPGEAVAIEDSLNGVRAAKAAGLFTVAVPGPMTRSLDFAAADLVVGSLLELPLSELVSRHSAQQAS